MPLSPDQNNPQIYNQKGVSESLNSRAEDLIQAPVIDPDVCNANTTTLNRLCKRHSTERDKDVHALSLHTGYQLFSRPIKSQ
jgi:hypothetical protein